MENVILTSHSGLDFGSKEKIFFNSLRNVYSGKIVVVTNNFPVTSFIGNSEKYKFDILPYSLKIHHCVDRFFHWKKILDENKYDNIFIIDLVDTFWQKNPFDFSFDYMDISIESVKFKECAINQEWIMLALGVINGKNFINKFGEFPVSCAGAIRGKKEDIKNYINFQCEKLKNVTTNLDQGWHNIYYRTIENNMKCSDELLSVGYQKNFKMDSKGNILNNLNQTACCVHQYVHHQSLKLIANKYYE
jgi:hypothetical protein